MTTKLKQSQFRATVNTINQVTVDKTIRETYGIQKDDEIVLEFKGKIINNLIEPRELLKQKKKEEEANK